MGGLQERNETLRTFLRRRYAAFGFVLTIPCQQHTFQLFSVPKFIPQKHNNASIQKKQRADPALPITGLKATLKLGYFLSGTTPSPSAASNHKRPYLASPKKLQEIKKRTGGASCPMEAPTPPTRSHNFHKTWAHPSPSSRPGLNLAILWGWIYVTGNQGGRSKKHPNHRKCEMFL